MKTCPLLQEKCSCLNFIYLRELHKHPVLNYITLCLSNNKLNYYVIMTFSVENVVQHTEITSTESIYRNLYFFHVSSIYILYIYILSLSIRIKIKGNFIICMGMENSYCILYKAPLFYDRNCQNSYLWGKTTCQL